MFPPLDRGGIFLPPVFLIEVEKERKDEEIKYIKNLSKMAQM